MTKKKKKYQWKNGIPQGLFHIDAQVAGDEIRKLQNKLGREIHPADIVKIARPKRAPLHPIIGEYWDDAKAAERCREGIAQQLLRSYTVIIECEGKELQVPAMVNVEVVAADEDDTRERGYYAIEQVLAHGPSRARLIGQALDALQAWRRKYEMLNELTKVFKAIDEFSI